MKPIALGLSLIVLAGAAHADSLRSQIEASDKVICAAMKKKDFPALSKAIKAGVTSDFVYTEDAAGKPQSFDKMMENMKMGLQSMKVTVVKSRILSLKEKGNTATCLMEHTMGGEVPGGKKPQVMVMVGTSTDSYVKVGGKWKMSKMAWKNGKMTMDGKPMDMSKMGGH